MNLSRRQSLGLLASVVGTTAAAVVSGAAAAAVDSSAHDKELNGALDSWRSAPPEENAELIQAWDAVVFARARLKEAKDALEWLRDEWKHRWPLAPEQILGFANADRTGGNTYATAEKDISGAFIFRDTSGLTSRMSKKMRQEKPIACFSVENTEWLDESIANWIKPRTARNPAVLAKKVDEQKRILAELREKRRLSESYYAETARLREASGIEEVKARISEAEGALDAALDHVSRAPAFTHYGLRIKACAIANNSKIVQQISGDPGVLGDMARIINAILDIPSEAQA